MYLVKIFVILWYGGPLILHALFGIITWFVVLVIGWWYVFTQFNDLTLSTAQLILVTAYVNILLLV